MTTTGNCGNTYSSSMVANTTIRRITEVKISHHCLDGIKMDTRHQAQPLGYHK